MIEKYTEMTPEEEVDTTIYYLFVTGDAGFGRTGYACAESAESGTADQDADFRRARFMRWKWIVPGRWSAGRYWTSC